MIWGIQTKKIALIFVTIGLMIASAGCSSDTKGSGVQSVQTATPTQASTPDQTATPDPVGSYKNPAKINDTVTLESVGSTYNVGVGPVLRGTKANSLIANENQFNDKPAPGYEYILVPVVVQYVKGDQSSENIGPMDFKAFANGVECKSSFVVLPNNVVELSSGDVMQGGIKSGFIVYQVPQNQEVLISYQPNPFESSTAYISVGNDSSPA